MQMEHDLTIEPSLYHFHIYFTDETETNALRIYHRAQDLANVDSVGRFHATPVGPHPVRQFQLLVQASFVKDVVKWLQDVRGELDVLIHPEIDDDLLAHTKLARWLGNPHELRLERFKPGQRTAQEP